MDKPKKDNESFEKQNMTFLEAIHEAFPGSIVEKLEKYHPIEGIQYFLVKIKDKIYYVNPFKKNQASYKEVIRKLRMKINE